MQVWGLERVLAAMETGDIVVLALAGAFLVASGTAGYFYLDADAMAEKVTVLERSNESLHDRVNTLEARNARLEERSKSLNTTAEELRSQNEYLREWLAALNASGENSADGVVAAP